MPKERCEDDFESCEIEKLGSIVAVLHAAGRRVVPLGEVAESLGALLRSKLEEDRGSPA